MTTQHPSLYSFARTPRPGSTQVLSHHHMRGVDQAFAYQGTRGGSSGAQVPLNLHHGAYPVNAMPHSGGPRSLHPGYTVRSRSSVIYILIKLAHQDTYGQ
jgi:hypothetical protein